MSENNPSPADKTKTLPAEDVKPDNIEAIKAKNLELLGEAKKAKEEARKLREQLESVQKPELEPKYKDVNKALIEKVKGYESQLNDTKRSYALRAIKDAIRVEATKLGAVSPEKVFKFIEDKDMDIITVDDAFNVDTDVVKMVLEKVKKENEDIGLFKKEPIKPKDGGVLPSYFQQGTKPIEQMSLKELTEQLKSL